MWVLCYVGGYLLVGAWVSWNIRTHYGKVSEGKSLSAAESLLTVLLWPLFVMHLIG